MKNIRIFLSEKFHFLVVKFSVYLNRHVFFLNGEVRQQMTIISGSLSFLLYNNGMLSVLIRIAASRRF